MEERGEQVWMKGFADEYAALGGDLWASSVSCGPEIWGNVPLRSPVLVDVVVVHSWDCFLLVSKGGRRSAASCQNVRGCARL